jgi:hypothetical protein
MSTEIRSFDEYWATFVREHWRTSPKRLRLLAASFGVARSALANVARPRALAAIPLSRLAPGVARRWLGERPQREPVRWAAAAVLQALGKILAGTMDEEVERVTPADAAGWLRPPPARGDQSESEATAAAERAPATPAHSNPRPAWAVWM